MARTADMAGQHIYWTDMNIHDPGITSAHVPGRGLRNVRGNVPAGRSAAVSRGVRVILLDEPTGATAGARKAASLDDLVRQLRAAGMTSGFGGEIIIEDRRRNTASWRRSGAWPVKFKGPSEKSNRSGARSEVGVQDTALQLKRVFPRADVRLAGR